MTKNMTKISDKSEAISYISHYKLQELDLNCFTTSEGARIDFVDLNDYNITITSDEKTKLEEILAEILDAEDRNINNTEIVMMYTFNQVMSSIASELQDDEEIMFKYVELCFNAYKRFEIRLFSDKIKKSQKFFFNVYFFLEEKLNKGIIRYDDEYDMKFVGRVFQSFHYYVYSDKKVLLAMVELSGTFLEYIDDDLHTIDLVKEALSQNHHFFRYVSEDFKDDKDKVLSIACMFSDADEKEEAYYQLSRRLQCDKDIRAAFNQKD